jgi:hypothetical protein
MRGSEKVNPAREQLAMGLGLCLPEGGAFKPKKGSFIVEMHDEATGKRIHHSKHKNLIVRDASIQAARLFKDNAEPNFGAYMLAVGTGATGNVLSPDAPDEKQRKLNAEIARKAFSSTTFRTSAGVAVAYPTKIVDFTTQFTASEAVGPLNEMGLISPVSSNPLVLNPNPNNFPTYDDTLDITPYDVQLNYSTFALISKPATATLTVTWRFTF